MPRFADDKIVGSHVDGCPVPRTEDRGERDPARGALNRHQQGEAQRDHGRDLIDHLAPIHAGHDDVAQDQMNLAAVLPAKLNSGIRAVCHQNAIAARLENL